MHFDRCGLYLIDKEGLYDFSEVYFDKARGSVKRIYMTGILNYF